MSIVEEEVRLVVELSAAGQGQAGRWQSEFRLRSWLVSPCVPQLINGLEAAYPASAC
jgi:hypothetical protein